MDEEIYQKADIKLFENENDVRMVDEEIAASPIHLELARQNLQASMCLFSNNFYPQAIFYLEQAVEEAVKFICIINKVYDEKELRQIVRHKPTMIYAKYLIYLKEKIAPAFDLIKIIPRLQEMSIIKKYGTLEIEKFYTLIENFEPYVDNPSGFISEKILDRLISKIVKLEEEIKYPEAKIETEKIGIDIKQAVRTLLNQIPETSLVKTPEEFKKELQKFESMSLEDTNAFLSRLNQELSFSVPLMFLSIILSPHAVSSRYFFYPHRNPLEIYNKEHLLVKRYDELFELTNVVLQKMFAIYLVPNNELEAK